MEPKWNERWLKAPPVCLHAKMRDELEDGFVCEITAPLSSIISAMSIESTLSSEKFILERVVYKLNNQQRKEKAFKGLQLIIKCLQRYFEMDLRKMLEAFASDIERIQETDDKLVYLPSHQSVQYYLSRLLGGAGLLVQITDYCLHSYTPIREQMALGHFLDKNLLYLGLIARIWVLSRYLVDQIQKCYDSIHSLLNSFPASQVPWLESSDQLPSNFQVWLHSHWPLFYHGDQRTYIELKQLSEDQQHSKDETFGKDKQNDKLEDTIVKSTDKHSTEYEDLDFMVSFGIEDDIGVPWAESTIIPLDESTSYPSEEWSSVGLKDESSIPNCSSPLRDQTDSNVLKENSSIWEESRFASFGESSLTKTIDLGTGSCVPLGENKGSCVPLGDSSSVALEESSSIVLEERNVLTSEQSRCTSAKKSRRMCVSMDYEQLGLDVTKCKSPRRLLMMLEFLRCVAGLMWKSSRHIFEKLIKKQTIFVSEFRNSEWDGSPAAKKYHQWCKKRVFRRIVLRMQKRDRLLFQRGIVYPESLQSVEILIDRFVTSGEGVSKLLKSIEIDGKMVFGSCSIYLPPAFLRNLQKADQILRKVAIDFDGTQPGYAKVLEELGCFKFGVAEAMKKSLPKKFNDRFTDVGKPRKRHRKKKSILNPTSSVNEGNLDVVRTTKVKTLTEIQEAGDGEGNLESSVSLLPELRLHDLKVTNTNSTLNRSKHEHQERRSRKKRKLKDGKVEFVKTKPSLVPVINASSLVNFPTEEPVDVKMKNSDVKLPKVKTGKKRKNKERKNVKKKKNEKKVNGDKRNHQKNKPQKTIRQKKKQRNKNLKKKRIQNKQSGWQTV